MTEPSTPSTRRPSSRTERSAGRAPQDWRRAESEARRLGWALFPVRLFLGVTFVYGGVQKLSDPGFLHPGAPTYIGTQLRGFANGTPGGFLLRAFAIPHPALSGVGVALVEIAVGLLVTTGLFTRPAAAAGLALNLLLFLTNSWHTYPYFLGSDIVFVFAWLPFVVVGAARQPTLEPVLTRRVARRGRSVSDGEPGLTRRGAVGAALGVVAGATAGIAGLSALLKGTYRPARTLGAAAPTRAATVPSGPAKRTVRSAPAAHDLPSGAVKLGRASQLPAGAGATYRDPGTGQPDIVIREASGTLVAHSAVCTHAGCTVGYQGGQIVCPCHGSVFDAQTGAVITGPATRPLASRRVIERDGLIYALPA
jgi:thiosulfate dehydrogenase (quinone) large subunit